MLCVPVKVDLTEIVKSPVWFGWKYVGFLQWIISELACYTYSMVVVPLYDTLGPDAIRFIINTGKTSNRYKVVDHHLLPTEMTCRDGRLGTLFNCRNAKKVFCLVDLFWRYLCAGVLSAEISTVICDKADKAQVLLDNVKRGDTPGLRRIILMDAFDLALVEHGQRCGVHVQALQEVEVCDQWHTSSTVPSSHGYCISVSFSVHWGTGSL